MRPNNLVNLNTPFTLVVPGYIQDTDIHVWYYVYGTDKVAITHTVVVKSGFKYITITTPIFDCHIFIKYGEGTEFIRVGNPPIYLMLHYNNIDNIPMEYVQYNYNSDVLKTGTLINIGDNFYVTNNINIENSFYMLAGGLVTLTMPARYISNINDSNGSILLERGKWQLIAIPKDGYIGENFIDVLSLQEGIPGNELIEICSAYPGHINKFLSYIPGFTSKSSEHNFKLSYIDNGNVEITAFWVKCKQWQHTTSDIVFNW